MGDSSTITTEIIQVSKMLINDKRAVQLYEQIMRQSQSYFVSYLSLAQIEKTYLMTDGKRYKVLIDTRRTMVKCISKYSSWNERLKTYHNKDHWEAL
jgi:hypothetical protein